MARKAKQSQQNRVTNTTAIKNSWDDDIPQNLHDLVLKQPMQTRSINPGGLAKSWEISPKSCNTNGKLLSLPQLCYMNIIDLEPWKPCWCGRAISYSPSWETNTPFQHMVFSNDPHNFVAVGITGVTRPLFMFYKQTCPWSTICRVKRRVYEARHDPNAHKWVKYDLALVDPHSSIQEYMQLVNIVGLNGKFYALSLQGTLVVIEEVKSRMIITRVSSSRAVPSVISRHFREYLIESNGEVWLIFLLSSKSISIVDNVEIFRLQTENVSWKKVERLGKNIAIFAGANCCFVLPASEVGCKGNCVYFTDRVDNSWWVYDVASGVVSPGLSISDASASFGLEPTIYGKYRWWHGKKYNYMKTS